MFTPHPQQKEGFIFRLDYNEAPLHAGQDVMRLLPFPF